MTNLLLASEGAFTIWSWLGAKLGIEMLEKAPPHMVSAWLVCIVLCVVGIALGARYRNMEKAILPPNKLNFVGLFETIAEGFVYGVAKGTIGHDYKKFIWLIGPLFFYILVGNLFGLLPGFLPSTDNMNTNLSMGIVVFVAYHIAGILEVGPSYARHFWAPKGLGLIFGPIVGMILLIVEGIGHIARPVSLSLRLFGNITGDHQVLGVFTQLVPVVVPVIFLCFGLMVAFIQAFIFTMLSAVYIALATSHDH